MSVGKDEILGSGVSRVRGTYPEFSLGANGQERTLTSFLTSFPLPCNSVCVIPAGRFVTLGDELQPKLRRNTLESMEPSRQAYEQTLFLNDWDHCKIIGSGI